MTQLEVFGPDARGITFLVGENGSGKSRRLAAIQKEAQRNGLPSIAISNTVYDRFGCEPDSYSDLATTWRHKLPQGALQQALLVDFRAREENLERILKVLFYLGFDSEIGISLAPLPHTVASEAPDFDAQRQVFLEYVKQEQRKHTDDIVWLPGRSGFGASSSNLLELLWVEHCRNEQQPLNLDFYLRKSGQTVPLGAASSGESTLLATYAFIASKIAPGTVLLIDEPENSLHPHWQHEYCLRLLEMFSLYAPSLVIATHSPIIVSGAHARLHDTSLAVFEVQGDTQLVRRQIVGNIEETLYTNFRTLSPSNHFLSETVARLLDELNRGSLSEKEFIRLIEEFKNRSYDDVQKKFLESVHALGASILSSSRRTS